MKTILFKDEINQTGYFSVLETANFIEQALALSQSITTRKEESNKKQFFQFDKYLCPIKLYICKPVSIR